MSKRPLDSPGEDQSDDCELPLIRRINSSSRRLRITDSETDSEPELSEEVADRTPTGRTPTGGQVNHARKHGRGRSQDVSGSGSSGGSSSSQSHKSSGYHSTPRGRYHEKGGTDEREDNSAESDSPGADEHESQVTLLDISKTLNQLVKRMSSAEKELKFVKQKVVATPSSANKRAEVPLVIRVSQI